MKKLISTLLLFIIVVSAFGHPLKTVVTDFTYLKNKNKVQVLMNFFEDDFEAQLSKIHNKTIDLDKVTKKKKEIINSYIKSRFSVSINNTLYTYNFLSYTVTPDYAGNKVIGVKLEFNNININQLDKLTMKNTLLFDADRTQNNLVRIDQFNDKKCRNLNFDLPSPNQTYIFK